VEFIIQWRVRSEVALEELANFFVGVLRSGELMPLEHAARVGVNYEYRMLAGIEENGVRGLGPDAMHPEELFAQCGGRCAEHPAEGPAVFRT